MNKVRGRKVPGDGILTHGRWGGGPDTPDPPPPPLDPPLTVNGLKHSLTKNVKLNIRKNVQVTKTRKLNGRKI